MEQIFTALTHAVEGTPAIALAAALAWGILSILLSHTHWDHTQGFAFFGPVNQKGNRFTFYANSGVDRRLFDVISTQMDYLYFPLTLEERAATLEFHELGEETFNLGDVQIATQFLNHTVLTLAFRISSGGVTMVYVADHEPFSPRLYRSGVTKPSLDDIVHDGDRKHVEFLRGADLVIHDAQYTQAEFANRVHWGHSTYEYAVDVCAAAGVKCLYLAHHDPDRDDAALDLIGKEAQNRARLQGSNLDVAVAGEGMVIELPEVVSGRVPDPVTIRQTSEPRRKARILLVDDEPGMVQLMEAVLLKDGYQIMTAVDGELALEMVRSEHPDLVLLDVMMPRLDGYEVLKAMRADPDLRDTPVIMLTARPTEEGIVRSFQGGVTDYISKPVAPALLRSRVRRWLLRQDLEPDQLGS